VTRLDLRLHPVGPELLCGFLAFPRERAAEAARVYRDSMAEASDQVGGGLLLGAGLGGVCSIVFCHLGSVEAGEEAVAPLRALQPSLDAVAPNPYRAFHPIWDTSNPPGVRAHLREASPPRAAGRGHRHRHHAREPACHEPLLRVPPPARRCARRRRMGLSVRRAVAPGALARSRAGGVGRRLGEGRRAVRPTG